MYENTVTVSAVGGFALLILLFLFPLFSPYCFILYNNELR